jgi:NAD(P)-dependent dehydrogenase (short-subunit alcohol dehydrogenase family)
VPADHGRGLLRHGRRAARRPASRGGHRPLRRPGSDDELDRPVLPRAGPRRAARPGGARGSRRRRRRRRGARGASGPRGAAAPRPPLRAAWQDAARCSSTAGRSSSRAPRAGWGRRSRGGCTGPGRCWSSRAGGPSSSSRWRPSSAGRGRSPSTSATAPRWPGSRRPCADVDVLVANAALPGSGGLLGFSEDEIDRALEVNLRAPMILARRLAERMAARGSGHILSCRRSRARRRRPARASTPPRSSACAGSARGCAGTCAPRASA